MAKKKTDDTPAPEPTSPETPASLAAEAAPEPAQAHAPALAAQVAKELKRRRFRVLKSKSFSWYGSMTGVSAGDIIDEAGYGGPDGIARLKDAGVELEEVA